MNKDELKRYADALNFLSEKTKQLITLATGILTVTITFAKDILRGLSAGWIALPLLLAWLLYLASIYFGVELFGRFAARLQQAELDSYALEATSISDYAKKQRWCFLGGLVFTIGFAVLAVGSLLLKAGLCGPLRVP